MTFYLKPPRGEIHKEKLEELTRSRIQLLSHINTHGELQDMFLAENVNLAEAVMEGSSKDRISHYMLRLSIGLSGSVYLKSKFLELETKLFKQRLKCLDKDEILSLFGESERHLNSLKGVLSNVALRNLKSTIDDIITMYSLPIGEYVGDGIKVPFYLVPDLVRDRLVILSQGYAVINKIQIEPYLASIFRVMLQDSLKINHFNVYGCEKDDDRILCLSERIVHYFEHYLPDGTGSVLTDQTLRWNEISSLSTNFPPCFSRLQEKLEKDKRLGHHARIGYTLFLKEIGLPLEESIKFWSCHYSESANPGEHSKCAHSWQTDGKKFIYNIRHLYGVSGSRKSYRAHKCASIINNRSPLNQLSCPFNEIDIEDLARNNHRPEFLNRQKGVHSSDSVTRCTSSCSRLLEKRKLAKEPFQIARPVDFYRLLS